jgi:hypothetical protein
MNAQALAAKAFGVWLLILLCAVLNGALRERVLLRQLGTPVALGVSGVLLSLCIVVVAFVALPRLGVGGRAQALYVGALWLALTLAFEFGFGRLVQGRSWNELLEAYTFRDGNIWPLVLVVTFVAPLVAVWSRGRP